MALTSLLGDIVKVVRGKGPGSVKIDNKVFQLHYRLTTFLFLGFSILVTANSLIGQPVTCACALCEGHIPLDVMNTHCWITSTYTVDEDIQSQGFSQNVYGLGSANSKRGRDYQTYYQWVPFMLALQGVLFYVPHWLWVLSEDGRMATMIQDIRMPVLDRGLLKSRISNLASYVRETFGSYQGYFIRFLLCDLLNVINVIVAIFVTNQFLNHKFLTYGSEVLDYFNGNRRNATVSPLIHTFPRQAKCELETGGFSGGPQTTDALCMLALNVLNEKVYLVLWFWLIFLSVLSSVVFIVRLVLMMISNFRVPLLEHRAHFKFTCDVKSGINSLAVGDFFLLSLLARNMDITAFRLLLKELAKQDFRSGYSEIEDDTLSEDGFVMKSNGGSS